MTLNPWSARGRMTAYENEPGDGSTEKYNADLIADWGIDRELFDVLAMIDAKLCEPVMYRTNPEGVREYMYVWLEEFDETHNLGAPLVYLGLCGWLLKTDNEGMDYIKQYFCVVDAVVEAWNAGHSIEIAREMVTAASAEYYG